MKSGKFLVILLLLLVVCVTQADAQCAMCTKAAMDGIAEGNTASAGINKGILLLLGMPYLLVLTIGGTWWYRKRQAAQYVLVEEATPSSELRL